MTQLTVDARPEEMGGVVGLVGAECVDNGSLSEHGPNID